jgi:hypothetical protein
MEQTPQSNPFATMHKQRLYSLIIAGVAFITLLLPWVTFGLGLSFNGFRGWGILSLLGIAGVVVSVFMGDKTIAYDDSMKKIAMGSFGAIALGALIFLITKNSAYGPFSGAGLGLWACLVVGLAGLAFLFGLVKIPENK